MNLEKIYYSTTEAAAISGLSPGMIRAGCKAGKYRFIKVGRVYRIDLAAMLEVLEQEADSTSA